MRKQIIVMRTDLKMRKGKMVAQGGHAVMATALQMEKFRRSFEKGRKEKLEEQYSYWVWKQLKEYDAWLKEPFRKICVGVTSEKELLDVHNEAMKHHLFCTLIIDSGFTEFHNVKTMTCCAIGPAEDDVLEPITGHLKLL
jgi:PTH2 family peptidyl-tRNA hydrolase